MLDRRPDLDLLGLELGADGRGRFELTKPLSRLDGRLFGGTALAVAIVAGEVASDQEALWTTVQFISGRTEVGDRIDIRTEVLAQGRRTAQIRVRGFVGDREIFCALGATGRFAAHKLHGTYRDRPLVLPPEECPPYRFGEHPDQDARITELRKRERAGERLHELRVARPVPPYASRAGELLLWTRMIGRPATPAVLGYLADVAPIAIAHAAGRVGGGTSIDNTVRFGAVPADTEWVLAQLDPHLASGGYGHGSVHLWSPDGELLATASQTATMLIFD